MKRLLCILSGMNAGGAETFLMKIYRTIDKNRYQFDFCINDNNKSFYEDEIITFGGKIFCIPSKSENLKTFKYQLKALIQKENYQYVLRITSNAMGFLDLKIAKKAGTQVCVARSSNSSDGNGLKEKVVHILGRVLYSKYVDVALAPSDLAAKYTFGEKAYKIGKVQIINNAVDLNVFHYDENARFEIRKEFGIDKDTKIIGHVGRFMSQKNHMFLAEIFKCIKEKDRNAKLFLVGTGVLREEFEKKAIELGIIDSIIFAGVRSDIPHILSAMDVMIFPSLYEGMPNTVIEAQATGLPCVIANTITREAKITDLVEYLPLSDSAENWAKSAMKMISENRVDTRQIFEEKNYDIQAATERFVNLIFER